MIHQVYFVLGKKDDESLFLTEDKTYTTQLSQAEEFLTEEEAQETIYYYQYAEDDEDYMGDFYVGHDVKIKRVETAITDVKS